MWKQIQVNQRNTAILIIMMAALLFAIGYFAFGGVGGLFIAGAIWIVLTLISYFSGDKIFLAVSGARKIGPDDHPVLYNIVEEMKIASGMKKMPDIYIMDDPTPNAFATGRSEERCAVAVTAGLLEILDRDELQGVMAHEIGHIRNRDILYMMMIGVMMGAIVMLADIGVRMMWFGGMSRRRTSSDSNSGGGQAIMMVIAIVLMILAPILAQMIYFAVSRKREYMADASGAIYTRYPEGLARALEKISGFAQQHRSVAKQSASKVNRVIAPSYIINPTMAAAGKHNVSSLFSTHPPTDERIRILRSMGNSAGLKSYDEAYQQVTGQPVGVIPFSPRDRVEDVPVKQQASEERYDRKIDRVRQTNDALWKLNDYAFIPCSCGTTLKIPPQLRGKRIMCPHCGTEHDAAG